jgi:5,10-methylene-tetrahydrofolate dehydrogenase/methenyl tetrahydrofolate cyclohydrolase
MASILDGKALADVIRGELKERVSAALASGRRAPCLGVVLVGSRPDSATYVRSKKAACAALGMTDRGIELPADATQAQVLEAVAGLNADAGVDGILVQLPLPAHIDERAVLGAISLAKDADGLHPLNVGALALKGHTPLAVACTPRGCVELLRRSGVAIEGKRAVVLVFGRGGSAAAGSGGAWGGLTDCHAPGEPCVGCPTCSQERKVGVA